MRLGAATGYRGSGGMANGPTGTALVETRVVRFENVGLRYGLGPEVLRDLTFRIEPHSFQFLTGPSGAGKTSLLRLMFLSLRPTRGLITQFGHDVASLSRDALATLRRRIGIVFQDFRLLDREALEAVRRLPERTRLYRGLTPWIGLRQCVIPYVAQERAAGRSQYGLGQRVAVFARGVFDFSSGPLYAGLLLGGLAVGLSTLYLLFILAWILMGEWTAPGWASAISVTLLLSSVSLAFSGIIGVYVARIYDEVRARPPYVSLRVRKHE